MKRRIQVHQDSSVSIGAVKKAPKKKGASKRKCLEAFSFFCTFVV